MSLTREKTIEIQSQVEVARTQAFEFFEEAERVLESLTARLAEYPDPAVVWKDAEVTMRRLQLFHKDVMRALVGMTRELASVMAVRVMANKLSADARAGVSAFAAAEETFFSQGKGFSESGTRTIAIIENFNPETRYVNLRVIRSARFAWQAIIPVYAPSLMRHWVTPPKLEAEMAEEEVLPPTPAFVPEPEKAGFPMWATLSIVAILGLLLLKGE